MWLTVLTLYPYPIPSNILVFLQNVREVTYLELSYRNTEEFEKYNEPLIIPDLNKFEDEDDGFEDDFNYGNNYDEEELRYDEDEIYEEEFDNKININKNNNQPQVQSKVEDASQNKKVVVQVPIPQKTQENGQENSNKPVNPLDNLFKRKIVDNKQAPTTQPTFTNSNLNSNSKQILTTNKSSNVTSTNTNKPTNQTNYTNSGNNNANKKNFVNKK